MISLIFRRNIDGADHDLDFLDALRDTGADNFILPDDERFERLEKIRDVLIVNDSKLVGLIEVKPEMEEVYRSMHAGAESMLSEELASMNLPNIIVKP